jgi:hypothetical protein
MSTPEPDGLQNEHSTESPIRLLRKVWSSRGDPLNAEPQFSDYDSTDRYFRARRRWKRRMQRREDWWMGFIAGAMVTLLVWFVVFLLHRL